MGTVINGEWQPLEEIRETTEETLEDTTRLIAHITTAVRWVGEHAIRNAEIDCGATGTMAVFQNTAGNDTWSATPLCLIGTGDGPFMAGNTHAHVHMMLVTDVAVAADTDLHYVRVIYGTGTVADAITAGQFTEVQFVPERGAAHSLVPFQLPPLAYGTGQLWLSHWVGGTNAPTMDFRIGLHECAG